MSARDGLDPVSPDVAALLHRLRMLEDVFLVVSRWGGFVVVGRGPDGVRCRWGRVREVALYEAVESGLVRADGPSRWVPPHRRGFLVRLTDAPVSVRVSLTALGRQRAPW